MTVFQKWYTAALAVLALTGICLGDDTAAATSPEVRVGIISDPQSYPGRQSDRGQKNLQKAFEQLRDRGVDVILFAGDFSDRGLREVYDEFHDIVSDVFGDKAPPILTIMGNHDFYTTDPQKSQSGEEAHRNFCAGMRQPSVNTHLVVNGYDFIGISSEDGGWNGTYRETSNQFLTEALAQADQRAPGKPIFIVTHEPGKETIYGSGQYGHWFIPAAMTNRHNVVHFAGHSLYPMSDERDIHQKEYTTVGTSSLSYTELEPGLVGGTTPPEAGLCEEYLYMEVFPDKIVLHRVNLYNGKDLKEPWILTVPLRPETFTYTEARAAKRTAPEFPAGATVSVRELSAGWNKPARLALRFPAARHPDFVHSYAVRAKDKEWLFPSDFYMNRPMADPVTVEVPLSELPETSGPLQLEVIPIESFGHRGKPIVAEFNR